ncbi:MAG: hypothetical protein JSS27_08415 [Planctomycetes bacterium]|nr:hypothetical protein [Planctomycetota bacterium]
MPLEPCQVVDAAGGQLWVDPQFAAALNRAGLATFADYLTTEQGSLFRKIANRESRRLELVLDDGRRVGAWLKRHRCPASAWRWWPFGRDEQADASDGRREALNAERLAAAGIAALRAIACGERQLPDGGCESFVLTEELTGYTQLDHFLDQRFATLTERGTRRDADLDRLLDQVADLARRFHQAGFNHRDFYCCHFFVAEPTPGQFDVTLIDLQRVEHRTRGRRRWLLKDLGQLSYSAARERISNTQRLRFLRRYLQSDKLGVAQQRFARLVLLKHAQLENRHGVHA